MVTVALDVHYRPRVLIRLIVTQVSKHPGQHASVVTCATQGDVYEPAFSTLLRWVIRTLQHFQIGIV
jgi:hypothetical protein